MALLQGGGRGPMSEINVTPMVDVVLVLLIIFMVAAPMIQQGVPVALPKAHAQPLEGEPEHVVVSLTKERQIFLGEASIPREQLAERLRGNMRLLQDGHVYLHADRSLDYGFVMDVMGALNGAGIQNVGLVTEP